VKKQYAMNKFFISASGLDARGVGPRIMLASAPFMVAAIVFEIQSAPYFEIFPVKSDLTGLIGWVWMAIGIVAFIVTMVQFIVNFPKGKLITKGMFACSRNPIYSTWIVFILPAAGMIFNNWFFFVAALAMCVATLLLVREEENQLLKVFGKPYADYRRKIGSIVRFL
jgi:protein-S-isoprenylcysteine O-methyltransferase Ste14